MQQDTIQLLKDAAFVTVQGDQPEQSFSLLISSSDRIDDDPLSIAKETLIKLEMLRDSIISYQEHKLSFPNGLYTSIEPIQPSMLRRVEKNKDDAPDIQYNNSFYTGGSLPEFNLKFPEDIIDTEKSLKIDPKNLTDLERKITKLKEEIGEVSQTDKKEIQESAKISARLYRSLINPGKMIINNHSPVKINPNKLSTNKPYSNQITHKLSEFEEILKLVNNDDFSVIDLTGAVASIPQGYITRFNQPITRGYITLGEGIASNIDFRNDPRLSVGYAFPVIYVDKALSKKIQTFCRSQKIQVPYAKKTKNENDLVIFSNVQGFLAAYEDSAFFNSAEKLHICSNIYFGTQTLQISLIGQDTAMHPKANERFNFPESVRNLKHVATFLSDNKEHTVAKESEKDFQILKSISTNMAEQQRVLDEKTEAIQSIKNMDDPKIFDQISLINNIKSIAIKEAEKIGVTVEYHLPNSNNEYAKKYRKKGCSGLFIQAQSKILILEDHDEKDNKYHSYVSAVANVETLLHELGHATISKDQSPEIAKIRNDINPLNFNIMKRSDAQALTPTQKKAYLLSKCREEVVVDSASVKAINRLIGFDIGRLSVGCSDMHYVSRYLPKVTSSMPQIVDSIKALDKKFSSMFEKAQELKPAIKPTLNRETQCQSTNALTP